MSELEVLSALALALKLGWDVLRDFWWWSALVVPRPYGVIPR